MRKMMIGGVSYLWKTLSYQNPASTLAGSIMVAYPENDPLAKPIFIIDNNGTTPFGHVSYATWVPTNEVHFEDPDGRPVTWEKRMNNSALYLETLDEHGSAMYSIGTEAETAAQEALAIFSKEKLPVYLRIETPATGISGAWSDQRVELVNAAGKLLPIATLLSQK